MAEVKVKRWRLDQGSDVHDAGMQWSASGEYVTHADYLALARVIAAADEMAVALKSATDCMIAAKCCQNCVDEALERLADYRAATGDAKAKGEGT